MSSAYQGDRTILSVQGTHQPSCASKIDISFKKLSARVGRLAIESEQTGRGSVGFEEI